MLITISLQFMSSNTRVPSETTNDQTVATQDRGIVYICAICGKETTLRIGSEVQCMHDAHHKILYKKREERPLVYKCI